MKKDYTDLTIVLDRSGSMDSIAEQTIQGFNAFLHEQQQDQGEVLLSLVQFNHNVEESYRALPIREIVPLDHGHYVTDGYTALLDALGQTIEKTGSRLAALAEDQRPSKVIVVVLTDGLENASKDYSQAGVSQMIEHQRQTYAWSFIFLGANQDAILEARKIGIDAKSALTFAPTGEGSRRAFASASKLSSRLKTEDEAGFSEEDREIQGEL